MSITVHLDRAIGRPHTGGVIDEAVDRAQFVRQEHRHPPRGRDGPLHHLFRPGHPPAREPGVDGAQDLFAPLFAWIWVYLGRRGLEPLLAKIHLADPSVSGALADWLSGVYATEGTPSAEARAALPAGAVLVNREGHQFTRHTVSFHAPDAADAGILARQAEIEALEGRLGGLAGRLAEAQRNLDELEARLTDRNGALEEARLEIGARQKAQHDAQIEHLKLAQAQERYRERSAQVGAELEHIAGDMQAGDRAAAESQEKQQAEAAEIAAAREQLEAARAAHIAAETALAGQRRAVQQAEREAQDALFGERECGAKIAEIDNSVKLIDQQVERADQEVARLTQELAEDPIPAVREALEAAVQARIAREAALAEARNAVEAAAGALRQLEEGKLQVEARVAPLRDRLGELRLKEQAAQLAGLATTSTAGVSKDWSATRLVAPKTAH